MSIGCLRIFGSAILLKTIESSHIGLLLRTISNLIFLAEQRICMPMFQAAAIFLVRSTHINHIILYVSVHPWMYLWRVNVLRVGVPKAGEDAVDHLEKGERLDLGVLLLLVVVVFTAPLFLEIKIT